MAQLGGNGRFGQDRKPIQTVHELQRKRNIIAHPKGEQEGSDVIVRHKDGRIEPPRDMVLAEGDFMYQGYGAQLDEFSAETAERAVSRTLAALRQLRDGFLPHGLTWIDQPADNDW